LSSLNSYTVHTSTMVLSTNTMSSLNTNLVNLSTNTMSTILFSITQCDFTNAVLTDPFPPAPILPGGNTAYLTLNINGTDYKIPLYT
jgi:hypothetical protein